jgi:hypothetical protein
MAAVEDRLAADVELGGRVAGTAEQQELVLGGGGLPGLP